MATPDGDHLDEGLLAGFVDRQLDPTTTDRVITHLETCAGCRAELRGVGDLVASAPQRRHRSPSRRLTWLALGGVLAASLVAVAVLIPTAPPDREIASERAGALPDGTAPIAVVTPTDGPVSPAAVTFTWRSVKVDTYRVTLLSEDGEVLSTAETSDTTMAWPRDVKPTPGGVYYWRVDGVIGTITAASAPRRLQLAR